MFGSMHVSLTIILVLWIPLIHSWSTSTSSSFSSLSSRRDVFQRVVTSGITWGVVGSTLPFIGTASAATTAATTTTAAADSTINMATTLQDELIQSQLKLREIPDLLQAQEWDKVRNILKTPPVNKLWNLGDSQNTVLKLAKETGDVELFELKDELAYNLQMCDQLTYDNVFVYFQPGSGKIKIKEPIDSAKKAMEYLDQVIAAAAN